MNKSNSDNIALVFILNLSFNLMAIHADLVTILTSSLLLSAFFIDLMSFHLWDHNTVITKDGISRHCLFH